MPSTITKLIARAQIYYADGAYWTAAARLRQASEEMQALADERARALEERP